MKILCTGGGGFIGSHLVDTLLFYGNKVVVIDNFSVGKRTNLPKHKDLTVIEGSILFDQEEHFKDIDIVFHLAAVTRPQESILDPILFEEVNVIGTLNVLNWCVKNKVKRFIFASSTALYGIQHNLPTPETAIPNPMSPYAVTKLTGEMYCELFYKLHGLEYNIVRPFNVYGSRQNPKGGYAAAVSKFIDNMIKGKKSEITGDGTQARDFIYVKDVAELFWILGCVTDTVNEVFNAGSEESTTINEIYDMISMIMGKNDIPNYIDPVYEPQQTMGNTSKAYLMCGWKAKTKLKDGLEETITEIRQ
jgi:nucleoside-diphosphate-sugar epimerase